MDFSNHKKLLVRSISEYVSAIENLTSVSENSDKLFVFRGENKVYPTPCIPNIFRNHQNHKYPFYERNMLDKIRSEGYDEATSYLLTAIEAQHGGFPSRLLDVSYNALVALYFAVTPFYKEREDSRDDENGQVILIEVDKLYSASSKDMQSIYDDIILADNSIRRDNDLLSRGFKFIDFHKKNKRVQAQHGGFILFYGMYFNPIPSHLTSHIVIHKDFKEEIRRKLSKYFNISTATIYPEVNNIVDRNNYVTAFYAQERKSPLKTDVIQIYERAIKEITFMIDHTISTFSTENLENLDCNAYLKLLKKLAIRVQDVEKSTKVILSEIAQGRLKLRDKANSSDIQQIDQALMVIEMQQERLLQHIETSFNRFHLEIKEISESIMASISVDNESVNTISKQTISIYPQQYFRNYFREHSKFLGGDH